MVTQSATPWRLKGDLIAACNYDYGCPCNFNAPPTYGKCEGPYVWHIEEGRYGEVVLDGFFICIAQEFPGPLYEGHGVCQFVIDANADERQRQRKALLTIL